jgi:predicted  nucleic acid-binding Zn-ribbon protein
VRRREDPEEEHHAKSGNALQKLRDEMVMKRRRLVDQQESIQNVQAEIEAIDRAIADEEIIQGSADTKSYLVDAKR